MNSGKEYSFLWFIENYSYCKPISGELISPEFTPQGQKCTSWSMRLIPGNLRDKRRYLNSLYLKRNSQDVGPENFSLKLEISVITADGSTLYSEECEHSFLKGAERGFDPLLDMDEFYERKNTEFLPRDTLGVRCRMWKGEGSVHTVWQCIARTRIGIEKISFLHRVENFSTLKVGKEKILRIQSHSKTGSVISSTLCVCDTWKSKERVIVQIQCSDSDYDLRRLKLSLLDVSGNTKEIGKNDVRINNRVNQNDNECKSFGRQYILNKREEYLPNDELSILCQYTFSTYLDHSEIEETLHEIPMEAYNRIYHNDIGRNSNTPTKKLSALKSASEHMKVNPNDQSLTSVKFKENTISNKSDVDSSRLFMTYNEMKNDNPHEDRYNAAEKLSMCPSVQDDLKALYNDQLLSDVVLKTATKSFPSHKIVLCARSSVFRSMLTSDMKEKNTDSVKVEDLENETVHQLLLFLYSDNLQDLQWESAMKLYYAGDKYEIEKLKVLCSSFLIDNVSASTASELLLLSDRHSDTDLAKFVGDFISEHEEEVFGSDEWESLSETNPQLVIKTMRLKYKREKAGE